MAVKPSSVASEVIVFFFSLRLDCVAGIILIEVLLLKTVFAVLNCNIEILFIPEHRCYLLLINY